MARRKRNNTTFNLSFLDIMSCGFGAVILFFVIINRTAEVHTEDMTADLSGEVIMLETEVELEKLNMVKLQNHLAEVEEEIVQAAGRSSRLLDEYEQTEEELSEQNKDTAAKRDHLNQLITDLQKMESELEKLQQLEEEGGKGQRFFAGAGDRQYLTGLRVGGEHVLILVDASASMLDDTIVNVIRRRNLPDEQKIRSEKWQRTVRIVDWLTTQIPPESKFQVYTYNLAASPVMKGTESEWLDPQDGVMLDRAVEALRNVVPENGTRLHSLAEVIYSMNPPPDNIYLIADGLPTQGREPDTRPGTVSSARRERYFAQAIAEIPLGIPINTILLPMEGDPMAASKYWQLAVVTGGSYMSPSGDWP